MNATRNAFSLSGGFKNFALKGNVIDPAVAVIIGAAFRKVIDSLVKHILMPLVGPALPGERGYLGGKVVVGAKEVPYGLFLGEVVNFLIVCLVLALFFSRIVTVSPAEYTSEGSARTIIAHAAKNLRAHDRVRPGEPLRLHFEN
jgi:large conductance mechanosensitive channel